MTASLYPTIRRLDTLLADLDPAWATTKGQKPPVSPSRHNQLRMTVRQLERALADGSLPRGAKSRLETLFSPQAIDAFLDQASAGLFRNKPAAGDLRAVTTLRDCLKILGERTSAVPSVTFDAARRERYLAALRRGASVAEATAVAGVSKDEMRKAVRADPEFAAARQAARAVGLRARLPHGEGRYNRGGRCEVCRAAAAAGRARRRAGLPPLGERQHSQRHPPAGPLPEKAPAQRFPRVRRSSPKLPVSPAQAHALYSRLADMAADGPLSRDGMRLGWDDRARLLAMVAVVLDTGARSGELAAMRMPDLAGDLSTVRVRRQPQNGSHLEPVTDVCRLRDGSRVALRRWLERRLPLLPLGADPARGGVWVGLAPNQFVRTPGVALSEQGVRNAYARGVAALNVVMAGEHGWEPLPATMERLRRSVDVQPVA